MSCEISDRRAGYQRQEAEPEIITCECGARVYEGLGGELIHSGPCEVSDEVRSS